MNKEEFIAVLKKQAKNGKKTVNTLLEKFKALPKKTQLISASAGGAVLFLLLVISFTGCSDKNVELVKKTILEYDTSRNIETALEARCSSLKWKSFKSPEGHQVVEVTGIWKDKTGDANIKYLVNDIGVSPYSADILVLKQRLLFPGDKIFAQFTISADGKYVMLRYGSYLNKDGQIKNPEKNNFTLSDTAHAIEMSQFLSMMYKGVQ